MWSCVKVPVKYTARSHEFGVTSVTTSVRFENGAEFSQPGEVLVGGGSLHKSRELSYSFSNVPLPNRW